VGSGVVAVLSSRMEIGYLWLTLSLFLFLMTTGAAMVLAAVAFPLVKLADEEHFREAFRLFRWRRMWSYGLLAVLAIVFLVLLLIYPMYTLPEWTMGRVSVVVGLVAIVTLASWFTSRKLRLDGYRSGRLRWLGTFHWVSAMIWLGGSCVLVWVFVVVVGLV